MPISGPPGGGGESNTASNVGASGTGLFYQKSGVDLQFKKLVNGSNITITGGTDTVTIAASGAGTGDVQGPGSSTTDHIPQFSSGTGKVLKDGLAVVTTIGSPGANTNVPTEAAVRSALNTSGGALDSLSDVAITTPAVKQVVRYNGSGWVNAALVATDISNVAEITGADGDIIAKVSGDWINQSPLQARALLGIDKGAFEYFDSNPASGTYTFVVRAPIACSIDLIKCETSAGTMTLAVTVNSNPVTFSAAVDVSSTPSTYNWSSGQRLIAIGDRLRVTYSNLAGTPENLAFSLGVTLGITT